MVGEWRGGIEKFLKTGKGQKHPCGEKDGWEAVGRGGKVSNGNEVGGGKKKRGEGWDGTWGGGGRCFVGKWKKKKGFSLKVCL